MFVKQTFSAECEQTKFTDEFVCGHMKENTLSAGTRLKREFSIQFEKERREKNQNRIEILDPFLVFLISILPACGKKAFVLFASPLFRV